MNHDEKNVSFDIDKNGWIKLYRQLLKKAIWKCSTPEQKVILITLLLMADHEGNEWEWQGKKYKTEPGQFITSLKSIAEEAGKGISIQNVRTSLNKFKKYEFLTYESTKTGRLITITNWTIYQSNKEKVTKEVTNDQQSTNKELTTNKNERIKEYIYSDSFTETLKLYPGKKVKSIRDKKLPNIVNEYGEEQIIRCIERYANEVKGKDKQFILNESTFWNGRFKDYLDKDFQDEEIKKPKEKFEPKFVFRDL